MIKNSQKIKYLLRKKNYILDEIKLIDDIIIFKNREIKDLENFCNEGQMTSYLKKAVVITNNIKNVPEEQFLIKISKIEKLKKEIEKEKEKRESLYELYSNIMKVYYNLDSQEKVIIEERYFKELQGRIVSWKEISKKINYSLDRLNYKHIEIIKKFNNISKYYFILQEY